MLNDPYHLMNTLNKMYFHYFPDIVRPTTIIIRDAEQIIAFYEKNGGKNLLKPLQGSGGIDVYLLYEPTNLNQIVKAIARNGFVITQEYLPDAKDGDTWVILMNGKVFQVEGKYAAIQAAKFPAKPFKSPSIGIFIWVRVCQTLLNAIIPLGSFP